MKQSKLSLGKNQILQILRKRELENLELLNLIEKYLLSKRGYIFKLPPSGSPVISLMSGGLDTTIVTAMLMEKYKLQVCPIYFERHIENSSKVKSSVNFFSKYFAKTYPGLFNHPITLSAMIPPKEISEIIFMTDSGETMLKKNSQQRRGIPFQPSIYAYYSLQYSQYLEEIKDIHIRNIFGGWTISNGNWYASETLTAIRAIMLNLCIMTKDYSWQFSALPLEKELGFLWNKETLIKWGQEINIPMELTWSCIHNLRYHCGQCVNCIIRKQGFQKAGVQDKTYYITPIPPRIFLARKK